MKCVICQGEEIEIRDVHEEIRSGSDIILVPIRVPVCQGCGEKYYDRRTVVMLEEAERQIREQKAKLQALGKVLVMG